MTKKEELDRTCVESSASVKRRFGVFDANFQWSNARFLIVWRHKQRRTPYDASRLPTLVSLLVSASSLRRKRSKGDGNGRKGRGIPGWRSEEDEWEEGAKKGREEGRMTRV